MIRVQLVDDHPLVRLGLGMLLGQAGDMSVVASTSNGADALPDALACHPDVVLMDLMMPGVDGVEAMTRIRGALPSAIVIVLTGDTDPGRAARARAAGAFDVLTKGEPAEGLLEAIRRAATGVAA